MPPPSRSSRHHAHPARRYASLVVSNPNDGYIGKMSARQNMVRELMCEEPEVSKSQAIKRVAPKVDVIAVTLRG